MYLEMRYINVKAQPDTETDAQIKLVIGRHQDSGIDRDSETVLWGMPM